MKKVLALTLAALAALALFAGCSKSKTDPGTIVVGASVTPHAEILEQVRELLKEKGFELEIVEFTDYVIPNTALEDGDLDANFFQHKPYMDNFNEENGTHLVSVAAVHYEPFGIYPGKTASIEGRRRKNRNPKRWYERSARAPAVGSAGPHQAQGGCGHDRNEDRHCRKSQEP